MSRKALPRLWRGRILALACAAAVGLSGCVSADPQAVSQAVAATLRAIPTATPIVVVVTALGVVEAPLIPSVTPPPPTAASPTQPPATLAPTQLPPAATPEATVAAAPSETATPNAVGRLIFEDNFTQPSNWDLGHEDDLKASVIANGAMSVTVKLADRFMVIYRPQSTPAIHMQVTATAPVCHTRDRYGLIFRVIDSQNYYQFDVDCDGRFRLAKMVAGNLTPLVNWTANASIRPGPNAVNLLTVRAVGETIAVSANGITLVRVTDATFALGGYGFSVGTGLTAPYTAVFRELRVSEPN